MPSIVINIWHCVKHFPLVSWHRLLGHMSGLGKLGNCDRLQKRARAGRPWERSRGQSPHLEAGAARSPPEVGHSPSACDGTDRWCSSHARLSVWITATSEDSRRQCDWDSLLHSPRYEALYQRLSDKLKHVFKAIIKVVNFIEISGVNRNRNRIYLLPHILGKSVGTLQRSSK